MNKAEVINRLLSSTRLTSGAKVLLLPAKSRAGSVISNWGAKIKSPITDPTAEYWFAMLDPTPDANWEHEVEYLFIDDLTGQIHVVRGTTPPDNFERLERIA